MTDGGPIYPDIVSITETEELLAGEVRSIVSYDGFWDPKAVDDVGEELDSLLRPNAADGPRLDPLRELVDRHEQMREAPGCLP
jgi:hypothetical protein